MKYFVLLLLLASCAKPRYADDPANAPSGAAAGPAASTPTCFADGTCVRWKWERVPTEEDFGSFTFSLYEIEHGIAVDPADPPAVLLWMPAMGHGSSPVRVSRVSAGSYRAEKVFFSMHGAWEIRFQRKEARDELVVPYSF
jgi:hypothetical protein